MTAPSALTPSRLRLILSISLALIVLAGAGIFYLAYDRLGETAAETGTRAASARESQDTLQRLQSLKEELDEKKDAANMASRVVANSQNYAYQDLLVNDLTIYANRADLTIKNISFSNPVSSPATGTPGGTTAPGSGAATGAPSGLNKATVDITLETPVNYQNLLNFLHYIEQNLTKLRISKVVMTKDESDSVVIDVLSLEVYIQ